MLQEKMNVKCIQILILLLFPIIGSAEPLRIGAIYGLSGPLSSLGQEYANSVRLAEEAAQGKVLITIEDSGWDPKAAVTAFRKFSGEGVSVFHVMGAGMSMAIKPLSERQKMLLYSTAAHPSLLLGSISTVRHANNAANDARILAEAILARRPNKVAAIYVQNEWGEFFNSKLSENFRRDNSISFEASPYLPAEADFRGRLLPLIAHRPDIFVVNSFGVAAGTIVKQLRQLGFTGPIFANNGFVLSRDTFAILGDTPMPELYFQDYSEPPLEFCNLYFSRYGTKPSYLALAGYTDIELLAEASARTGRSAQDIAAYIRSIKQFRGKYMSLDISSEGDMTVQTVVRKWSKLEYNSKKSGCGA